MDTKYPESLSRILRQRDRRKLRRVEGISAARHRTQPITFSEIQEVDEDNLNEEDEEEETIGNLGIQSSKSVHDMNMRFEQFLMLNYNRPEKKKTKKSLNKLSLLGNMQKPQSTVQEPETSPIPASPENIIEENANNSNNNNMQGENEFNLNNIVKQRTSI